ncbi:hypothetical protein M9H77_26848 [Catharanthus roseus]|uniref:Uncharacterized protein n=1 Tax=Catharanthus roseus TaxID=4058 RepID=A0ACC0ACQ9_CATRO|nr:hypothetical protein M9H77_26848 [Catharanthus roseus]
MQVINTLKGSGAARKSERIKTHRCYCDTELLEPYMHHDRFNGQSPDPKTGSLEQILVSRSQYQPELQSTLYERSIFQPHTTYIPTGNEPWGYLPGRPVYPSWPSLGHTKLFRYRKIPIRQEKLVAMTNVSCIQFCKTHENICFSQNIYLPKSCSPLNHAYVTLKHIIGYKIGYANMRMKNHDRYF